MRITPRLLIVGLLLWSGWACTDTLVDVVDVAVLEIEPQDISITPGESRQLQARVRDAEGNILSGRTIQWSSNAGSVASVSANGMVLGESAGTARITATSEGIQGTADVTVSPAPVISAQPDSVSLEAVIDETETAAAAIAITNGGGGSLAGLAAAIEYDSGAGDWLDAVLSGTAAPATLNVAVDADGLARGTYRASVRLTSTSVGTAPITVRVVFTVLQRSPAPTLVSVTPNLSAREQSLDVIMTGSGYVPGLTTVSFGSGITVNSVNVQGPTTLTAGITVGATAAVGTRTVSVINPAPGGGTASLADAFTVEGLNPRPTITSVAPATAQRQSTLNVVISGTGFLDDITIADFGPGITINSADVTSATALTANITIGAAAATGIRDITVANPEPGGGVGTLRDAFTVTAANPPPTFTGVTPASAQRLQTVEIALSGGNFSTDLTSIDFGAGITVSGMTVVDATTITADITIDESAALGPRAVSVTNAGPGGGTATITDGFTVLDANPAPVVQSVLPVSGRLAQILDVAVTGTGFIDGVTTIAFGAGITVNTTTVTDATSLTANITVAADAALGVRDVTATNGAPGGGTSTLPEAFTVFGAVSADLSTVAAAPSTNVAADGSAVSTVTVTLRDGASGAVTGLAAADFALSVTGSATVGVISETATPGTYTFTVSNTVAETVTVTVTAEGTVLTATPTVAFVATVISAANSSVAAAPLTGVVADGVAESVVTVVLRDANDNAVGGLATTAFAVTLGGSSATASDIVETSTAGTYTFGVSNTVAEQVTVSVSAGGVTLSQQPVIEFVPGSGSAAQSTAVVPPTATAGAATAIVITVRDASGNPVVGVASDLSVSVTGANTAAPAVSENGDGTYSATYTPTVAGSDDVAITLGGVAIAGSPFTSVVGAGAISAAVSDVTASPASVVADGSAASTVTVALRDANGNAIGGVAATDFARDVTGSGIAGTLSETATSGTYTFAVMNTVAETVTVTVEVRGLALADAPAIQFTAGGVSATNSGATANPATGVVANGNAASTVTVTLRDASNNAIGGLGSGAFAVTVSGSGTAGAVSETGTPGTYTFSVTNTVAQSVTVAVQAGGVTLSQQPAIQFVAGPASQVAINTGNNQNATIGTPVAIAPSVIVRDANSNPVGGVSVTFAVATGGGSLAAGGTVATNASGIATSPAWTLGETAGSNTLTATSAGLTGSPVTFTATGTAGSATQMSLTTQPSASAVSGAAFAQQPVIQLRDGAGNPVANEGVVVTASIATGGGTLGGTADATTNASGVASFTNLSISGLVGDRTLEFTAAGIAAVLSNAISITAGGATHVAVNAGNGQSATVGTAVSVPPSVIVTDASGNPISGVSVTFVVATGGGSLATNGAVTTNGAGVATAPTWTLGTTAGANTLTATSAGLTGSPITFTATGTSGAATQMTIETQPSATAQSGTAFAQQPVIQIRDGSNNVVAEAGVVITAAITSGGGTLGGTLSATTNASGVATFTNLAITGAAGDRTLEFTAGGITPVVSGLVSIGAGAATQLTISTQPSSTAQSGVAIVQQPVVQLRDGGGNAVATAGTVVTAAIASGGGTLSGTLTATTSADGVATFADLMITGSVGARTLRFTSGGLTAVTSDPVSVTAGAASQMAVNAGDGQAQTAGQPVPFSPSVVVRDASGNSVSGAAVTFAVTDGGGGLAASGNVVTGAGGIATSPVWTLGTTAGQNTLTATSGSLTPVVFTATGVAGDAARITITTQPAATAASGATFAPQPAIQLRDSNNNPVAAADVMVTAVIASGSGTLQGTTVASTNEAGLATFANLSITGLAGERTLSFTSGALTAATSNAINITAGTATQIAVNGGNNQDATVGTAVPTAPSVIVRDASLNPVVGVSVTFAVESGGGSLGASGVVQTNASGVAASPAWTLGTTVGANTLTATAAGLAGSPVTFTATGTAGAATQLTITTQPSATAASGAAFAQQPSIQLRDGSGNPVAQAGTIVTAAIASGGVTLGGTLTATTDETGLATFTNLSITGLVGERTLSFTSGALTAATSSAINITAGTATQLTITTQPSATAASGAAFAQQPAIQLRDAGGNPVATSGLTVTAAIASGGVALGGTLTATTNEIGLATFANLSITGLAGERTLSFTSAALTAATSSAINVTAGTATQIAVNSGDNQSATVGTAVAIPPSVIVRDASMNPVVGVSVTFAVESGGGSLGASGVVQTNASGVAASPAWTLGTTVGANTLTATAAGLAGSPVTFTATGTAGAATQLTITTQPSATAASGAAFAQQPAIQLRDASNNPVAQAGTIVTAAIASGGVTLGGTLTATTDETGLATFTDLSITGLVGERTLSFTSGALTTATSSAINITAGTATQLTITTQPSATAASGAAFAQQPSIQLRDGSGNPVAQAGTIVTAGLASGEVTLGGTLTATTDAAGIATFENLSITGVAVERTLSFTSGALTTATSSAINITAGTATQLTITTQPSATAASGAAFAQQPSIQLRDGSGNPVAQAGTIVTAGLASGEVTLGGTLTATTDAAGIATFENLSITGVAGLRTLSFTSGALTAATSSAINITAGTATQLTITTQPSATAASGAAFAQQPAIQLRDGSGNAVEQIGVVVTAAIATGGAALGGTLTATTDATGLATFADLSITGLVGERTLSFTSGAFTAATSGSIDITTGAAATITENGGNNQSATAGTAVAVAPSVIVTDTGGNPIAGVSVTFAAASGGGSLATPDAVVTDAAGIATSPTWTLGPAAGENTLTATSASLAGSPVTFTATGTL